MICTGLIDIRCHSSSTLCCQRNAAEGGEELQDLLQLLNFIMFTCKSDVHNMHHGRSKQQMAKHPVSRSSRNRILLRCGWYDNIKTGILLTP
jgi:hypothetical protein